MTAERVPPPCDPDIYQRGEVVLVTHSIPSQAIEAWVRCVAVLSGEPVDWHWAGGRAAVRTTGDRGAVEQAITLLKPALDQLLAIATREIRATNDGQGTASV